MSIVPIKYGSLADPEIINNNFEYLDEKITDTTQKIYTNNSSLESKISAVASQIITTSQITPTLQAIYPVGAIYIGTTEECPIANLFGTWEKVSEGRVLQGVSGSQAAGNTVEAGLPNIKGVFPDWIGASGYQGAFYNTSTSSHTTANSPLANPSSQATGFDASKANSIYKDDCDTVQPPAYLVNIWRRTA